MVRKFRLRTSPQVRMWANAARDLEPLASITLIGVHQILVTKRTPMDFFIEILWHRIKVVDQLAKDFQRLLIVFH